MPQAPQDAVKCSPSRTHQKCATHRLPLTSSLCPNQFCPHPSQRGQVPSNDYTNYRCGAPASSPALPLLPASTAPTSSALAFALPLQPLHSSPNVPLRLRPLPVVSPSVPLRTISRSRPPSSGPCSSPSTAIDSRHRLRVCGSALPSLLCWRLPRRLPPRRSSATTALRLEPSGLASSGPAMELRAERRSRSWSRSREPSRSAVPLRRRRGAVTGVAGSASAVCAVPFGVRGLVAGDERLSHESDAPQKICSVTGDNSC
jgi:hypothetical protein